MFQLVIKGSEYGSESEDESDENNGLDNPPTDEEKLEKGSVGREPIPEGPSLSPNYQNANTQREACVTLQPAHMPNEAHVEGTQCPEHEPSEPSDPQHEASIESPLQLHGIAEPEHKPHTESPLQAEHEPYAESPLQAEHEPRSESPLQSEDEPCPESPLQPEHEPCSESPLQPECEPHSESPLQPEQREPHSESLLQPEQEPRSESPLQPEQEPRSESLLHPEQEPRLESPLQPDYEPHPESPLQPEYKLSGLAEPDDKVHVKSSEKCPEHNSPSLPTPQDQEQQPFLETAVQSSVEEVELGCLVASNPPLPIIFLSGLRLVPNSCLQPEPPTATSKTGSPAVCHPPDNSVPNFIHGSVEEVEWGCRSQLVAPNPPLPFNLPPCSRLVPNQCSQPEPPTACSETGSPAVCHTATLPPAAVLSQERSKLGSSTASVPYKALSTKVSPSQPDDDNNSNASYDDGENSSFNSEVFDGEQSQATGTSQDAPNILDNAESVMPANSPFEQEPRSPSLPRQGRKKKRRKGSKKS